MGAKILLATAETEAMAKIEMSLTPRGHQVVPVSKLNEASVLLEDDSTFDLVMCDLIFPIGDSFELLKQIRADHLRNTIPFIFVVAEQELLTDSLRRTAAIYGADKFIFMDEFDPHRIRCEIEAMLPEQMSTSPLRPDVPDINVQQPDTGASPM